MPENYCQSLGGVLCWRRRGEMMYASLEARWLMEISEAAGYVVLVVSASFGRRGATRSYYFACTPEPRERSTLPVATYSGGGGRKKGSWRK